MKSIFSFLIGISLVGNMAKGQEQISASLVETPLQKAELADQVFEGANEVPISLMAQPMMPPRPATTKTSQIFVKAVHNGEWIAFRLRWRDKEYSEGGPLGKFSDAVALEFPKTNIGDPPPAFMGAKGQPVHIMHWRAQYQADKVVGRKGVRDHYAQGGVDQYHFEYPSFSDAALSQDVRELTDKDGGKQGFWNFLFSGFLFASQDESEFGVFPEKSIEVYQTGRAAGNPQSYRKAQGIDDITAEGFGTSQVLPDPSCLAFGRWQNGEWVVTISRPLSYEGRSKLETSTQAHIAFAVWQGGEGEVGGRKSVTMSWIPLNIQ
jgi:DMSO reductase family type II enzyme heme b subunit